MNPTVTRNFEMKKLTQISLLLLGLIVSFAGCDAAKDTADQAKDAGAGMVDSAKDLANIDFGDFDIKGLQEKFAGITAGFKDVSADNVGGLTSKLSDLGGSLDSLGIGNLTGPAKTAVNGVISTFVDAIKSAMDGISDEGILSKLKPAVDSLMKKLDAFK
jgi:hypothetical protein